MQLILLLLILLLLLASFVVAANTMGCPRKTPEEIARAKIAAQEKKREREQRLRRQNGIECARAGAIAQVTPEAVFPIEIGPPPNDPLLSRAAIDELAMPLPELLTMIMKDGYKPQFPLEAHPDMTETGRKTCHEFYKQEWWFHCPLCRNRGPHIKKRVAAEHCSACQKSINKYGVSVTSSSNDMDPFFPNGYPDHLPKLRPLEVSLIATCVTAFKVYPLPGGLLGYKKGGCISFEKKNFQEYLGTLPPNAARVACHQKKMTCTVTMSPSLSNLLEMKRMK
jgi:hypothetical protein